MLAPTGLSLGDVVAWSPDSQRLALVAWRGSEFQVQVWERASGRLRAITPFYETGARIFVGSSLIRWVSAMELLLLVPPQSEQVVDRGLSPYAQPAVRGWRQRERGGTPSTSILESGVETSVDQEPKGKLMLVNVLKGTQKELASGHLWNLELSPDKKWASCIRISKRFRPDPKQPIPSSEVPVSQSHVVLVPLQRPSKEVELSQLNYVAPSLFPTVIWSPDGTKVALINLPLDQPTAPELYVYTIATSSLIKVRIELAQGKYPSYYPET